MYEQGDARAQGPADNTCCDSTVSVCFRHMKLRDSMYNNASFRCIASQKNTTKSGHVVLPTGVGAASGREVKGHRNK